MQGFCKAEEEFRKKDLTTLYVGRQDIQPNIYIRKSTLISLVQFIDRQENTGNNRLRNDWETVY